MPYKQQVSNVGAFGQQSSLNQLGQLPTQIPVTNQIPVNQNQILANPSSIGAVASNPLGNCLHIGQMNQLNGVPNAAIAMPPQMVYKVVFLYNNCLIIVIIILIISLIFISVFFLSHKLLNLL